jgi:hypothetical protein
LYYFCCIDNADTELEVLISALKTAAAATDELDTKFSAKEAEEIQHELEQNDAVILKHEYNHEDPPQDQLEEDEGEEQHGQEEQEEQEHDEMGGGEEMIGCGEEEEGVEQCSKDDDDFVGMGGVDDEDSMDAMPLDVPDFSLISSILGM